MKKNIHAKNILTKRNIEYWVKCGILGLDEIALSESEVLMSKILDNIHMYKISQANDGRWITNVPDNTKTSGLRQIRRKSKSDLYAYLLYFYGLLPEQMTERTFGEVFLEWIKYKETFTESNYKPLSPSTIKRYKNDYEKYLINTSLNDSLISIDDINLEKLLIEIVSSFSIIPSAFNNVYGYINMMFQYAVRKKYISTNPMVYIDKIRIMSFCCEKKQKCDHDRVLSNDDLSRLIYAIDKHLEKYPSYMPDYAIKLALLTGMRVSEIVALKWECVDKDYIHIDYAERRKDYDDHSEIIIGEPKNGKHRLIPMTNDIKELFDIIRNHSKDETWVFAQKSKRITANTVSGACRRRSDEASIKRTSIHEIRRTVSSYLNTVLPRKAVANMLGHLPTTNERFYDYDISSHKDKAEALEKLSKKVINISSYKKKGVVNKAL